MDKKYLAFLDILGFKNLVKNNSLENLQELYERSIRTGLTNAKVKPIELEDNKLNIMIVSDSIIVWGEHDSFNAFANLIVTVSFFLYAFLEEGLPLRGAIVYDELKVISIPEYPGVFNFPSKNIIGKSLVTAYKLEEQQAFVSCIIESNCIKHFNSQRLEYGNVSGIFDFKEMINLEFIIEYIPAINECKNYFINWPRIIRNKKPTEEYIIECFSRHKKSIDDPKIKDKLNKTIEFVNYCWENAKN